MLTREVVFIPHRSVKLDFIKLENSRIRRNPSKSVSDHPAKEDSKQSEVGSKWSKAKVKRRHAVAAAVT